MMFAILCSLAIVTALALTIVQLWTDGRDE
jgi:hypothetical protein